MQSTRWLCPLRAFLKDLSNLCRLQTAIVHDDLSNGSIGGEAQVGTNADIINVVPIHVEPIFRDDDSGSIVTKPELSLCFVIRHGQVTPLVAFDDGQVRVEGKRVGVTPEPGTAGIPGAPQVEPAEVVNVGTGAKDVVLSGVVPVSGVVPDHEGE